MDGIRKPTKVDFGIHETAMQKYLYKGEQEARLLGNRGPIRFNPDGTLHAEILETYSRCGFYIFEGVLSSEELADLERDFLYIRTRLPTERGAKLDTKGRPALGSNSRVDPLYWANPLADPWG